MKRYSFTCVIILFAIVSVLWHIYVSESTFASEISVNMSTDRNSAVVGEVLKLTISVTGVQSFSAPELSDLEGFEIVSTSTGRSISIVNGTMTSSVNFEYRLRAIKEGVHEIGPFTLLIQNKEYKTDTVIVEVISGFQTSGAQKTGTAQDENLFITVELAKGNVYLGELIPLKVKLYARDIRVNQISYPTITATGFSVGSFGEPLQYEEAMNGRLFNVVEFTTHVVPVSQGRLKLGPAQIKAEVLIREQGRSIFGDPFFDEFFSSYRTSSVTVNSDELEVDVKGLPTEDRPETFSGAVGRFSLSVEANPESVSVGDPIVLTMRIRGSGNFKAVSSPVLRSTAGFKVYDPQVKESDSTAGIKVFEQVIIPTDDSVTEVPEVLFSYFDPAEEVYKTVTSEVIPIHVIPGVREAAQLVEASRTMSASQAVIGEDIFYIKDDPGRIMVKGSSLHLEPWFWALNAVPIMGLAGVSLYSRRKTRLENDMAFARSYRAGKMVSKGIRSARTALERGDIAEFCDVLHRTIQQYLGDKFNLPAKGISADVAETLKHRGVPFETLDMIERFFQECDIIRFAPLSVDKSRATELLRLAEQLVGNIEGLRNRGDWV